MTNIEELEKKIVMISERYKKYDDKHENNKKEKLIKAKHTNELIFPCIMFGIICFLFGALFGVLIS